MNDVKKIYLCRPNKDIICELNGIQLDEVSYEEQIKDFHSLTFTVDENIIITDFQSMINYKVQSAGYEFLHAHMLLYLEDIGYFIMQEPSINFDGIKETKSVTAYACYKEFEDKDLVGFAVNTGEDGSLERYEENLDELGFAKEYVTFYNIYNPKLSLMDLVLEKLPNWSVGYIDPLIGYDKENDRISQFQFDVDSENIYSFLTDTVATYLKCIFEFDIINYKVNVYSIYKYGEDTNVFLGFRNVVNTLDISTSEDSIYTRFNVSGGEDLTILDVNYNDTRIFNGDYYMCEPYMSEELILKIKEWQKYRDDNRETFIQYNKDIANYEDKIYEIKYRLPNDGDDYKQWDEMTEELLRKNLTYYEALLTSLRISVDTYPEYIKNDNGEDEYVPWKKPNGEIDDQKYLDLLYKQANGYGGYYTYIEVETYIIPNINIALSNINIPEDNKTDYIKEFETNWELYGTIELQGKLEAYNEQLNALKEKGYTGKPYSELTSEEKAKYAISGEEAYNIIQKNYTEIVGYIGTDTTPGTLKYKLFQLNNEIKDLQEDENIIIQKRLDMITEASLDNERWFTKDERKELYHFFQDTDYTNENILTTSIDTTVSKIDVEKDLYDDAVKKLTEVAQPQYEFSIELDNLLSLEEFKTWRGDVVIGNYIRLGIRDDYSVKLRIVSRSWNPCEVTSDIEITFSNMITSSSGRDDLTYLLDEKNGSGKNSINGGTGSSKDEKEYMTNMLQLMIQSQLFKGAVSNVANSTIINGNSGVFNTLVGEYISVADIDVSRISGDEANFNKLFAQYIDTDYIATRVADITELNADSAFIKYLNANLIVASEIKVDELQAKLAEIDFAKINNATINTLISDVIKATKINVTDITGDSGSFTNFFVNNLKVDEVFGDNAEFNTMVANLITSDKIVASFANLGQADITTLFTDTAFAKEITSIAATTATSTIDTGYIKNIISQNITVGDLQAGDITLSDEMRILSDNGMLVMNGSVLQFLDADKNVGIQIGYDGTNKPSIVIRDDNGSTMFTSQSGITAEGIPDGVIVDGMIDDGTISEGKLGFDVIKPNEYGGIDINDVYDGDGNKFGIEWTSFKNNTELSITALSTKIDSIELVADCQVFKRVGNAVTPESITVTAICRNNATVARWYIDGIENTEYVSSDKGKIIIPYTFMDGKETAVIRVENEDKTLYDLYTIYCVSDGKNGADSVSVFLLSSKGNVFKNGSTETTVISCVVYKGGIITTPNSYAWFYLNDDNETWTQLDSTRNAVEVSTADFSVIKRLKCQVDI